MKSLTKNVHSRLKPRDNAQNHRMSIGPLVIAKFQEIIKSTSVKKTG